MKTIKLKLPDIPEDAKSPAVLALLNIIDNLYSTVLKQQEDIQKLKDEIARLKNDNQKPRIKPSKLNKNNISNKLKNNDGKRPGSAKKKKTAKLTIHKELIIEPDNIPEGSRFKGYKDFVVQDVVLESRNTKYRLAVYKTPAGKLIRAKLPAHLDGKHFGGDLLCFCLYQHYHCMVTQPLLLEQLAELGVQISAGQLNNILIENKDQYHNEKEMLLASGIKHSPYINVDDTGARHMGKNGYCAHIGNEDFAWFESTDSKSRINFLKIIRGKNNTDYQVNEHALDYMAQNKLPKFILKKFAQCLNFCLADDDALEIFFLKLGMEKQRHVRIAVEGLLVGAIAERGVADDLTIISDDAGQFNVFRHGLCWIHAERLIGKIIPFTDQAAKDLKDIRSRIWDFYDKLKAYKQHPDAKFKISLEAEFDEIFTTQTESATLNNALKRLWKNKSELLLALERPDVPLHNNCAENSIREYVKKRKISGGTRSDNGRQCRDTFASLKKTCRKQGVSFWRYLKDRVFKIFSIPDLSDLIKQNALQTAGSI